MGERLSTSEVNAIMKQRDREAERDATIDKLLSNTAGLNTNVKTLKQELDRVKAEKAELVHQLSRIAAEASGQADSRLSRIYFLSAAAIKKADGE